MKTITLLLAGLVVGAGIGWYAGHSTRPTREQIVARENSVQTRTDEAAQRAACLEAMAGIKILESGGKKETIRFLAQQIASYNYDYAIKPTTNHDILLLRRDIADLAKTNAIVATELEVAGKSAQNSE